MKIENPIRFNPESMTVREVKEATETLRDIYRLVLADMETTERQVNDGDRLYGFILTTLENRQRRNR